MEINGTLHAWFETGTEGFVWTVFEDGKSGYEGMKIIEEGDELIVYDEKDHILFQGRIEEDTRAGWTEHYVGAGHGQPAALGYWIHWTQKGYTPEDWARMFFHGQLEGDKEKGINPYKAKLIKKGL